MRIGLLLNSNSKLCTYSKKYEELLVKNGIPYALIDPNSELLLDEIKDCTHFLFRHSMGDTDRLMFESIFNIANNIYKIRCFPNFETSWPHENKVKEYYLLKSHNFPIIDSRVFWNYTKAYEFINTTHFPIVGKLSKGAGSSNVVLINSIFEGKRIIDQVFKKGVKTKGLNNRSNLFSFSKLGITKYSKRIIKSNLIAVGILKEESEFVQWQIQKDCILFQKFLPDNTFDYRITVIGKRAFAFRRFVRKNDFRASGSGNIDFNPEKIDTRCIEMAFEISKKLNFSTMAYDFIYDENKKPCINEISYGFIDKAIHTCPGFWDEALCWHTGQNWPQFYQLSDFLQISDLKSI